MMLDWDIITKMVDEALVEDVGQGDITTDLLVPEDLQIKAEIHVKESCCLAGGPIADKVFERVGGPIQRIWHFQDGDTLQPGRIASFSGQARAILKAERTAINILQYLSAIATKTREIVNKVKPYTTKILDTRKTIPGWRHLSKYAVKVGGGTFHRRGLDDAILVKRNHFLLLQDKDQLSKMLHNYAADNPETMIIIEASNRNELERAIQAGADVVLLDNHTPEEIEKVLKEWKGKAIFEASGNINEDNVREYAQTGVERISMGRISHSVRAIDFNLKVIKTD